MTYQDPVVPPATRSGQAASAAPDPGPQPPESGTEVAAEVTGGPGDAPVPTQVVRVVRGAEARQAAQVADTVAARLRRPADEEAEAAARRRAEFAAPALRVIESDPAARAALEAARPEVERASLGAFSLVVHENTTFVVPPYDEPWYEGYPAQRTVDTGSGAINIHGGSGHVIGGADGLMSTAAGVNLVIQAEQPALIEVRPWVNWSVRYLVGSHGLDSSGRVTGGIQAQAFEVVTWGGGGGGLGGGGSHPVTDLRRSTNWNANTSADPHEVTDDGTVSDLWLRFPIQPGVQRYVAHVGAWLECDAVSGWGGITGVGEALATVQAVVKWMVVAKV
ncbi:hypothetical protein ACRYCC_15885 [Actinomadura scrupuli]|uniref:hypothetical protein n=1 Tax=Actinomadura scrupuli TaxID=559629 RepID=UPI003D98EACF